MTAARFRKLVLDLPETEESAHMGHPDFRRGGTIFATMGYPDESSAMVKLTPEQQNEAVHGHPEMFAPANGAWGRQGSTLVRLAEATDGAVVPALRMAWENAARPKPGRRRRPSQGEARPLY